MQQLNNEEIAHVFAMYWGCECLYKWYEDELSGFVLGILLTKIGTPEHSDFKLLLTPLSAITDEHAIEVAKITLREDNFFIKKGKYFIENFANNARVHQYLIQKNYAVPLFFSINHWANNKTAIELQIAIDKTLVK